MVFAVIDDGASKENEIFVCIFGGLTVYDAIFFISGILWYWFGKVENAYS